MKHLRNLLNKIKDNAFEYYITALVVAGLPIVALIYFDLRAAVATFVVTNVGLGIFALRNRK